MAQKHELKAKLQAARQTSGKIVEALSKKTYPEESENRQLEIPHMLETLLPTESPVKRKEASKELNSPEESQRGIDLKMETELVPKKEAEKITYTTISVPKQYGQKAKRIILKSCGAKETLFSFGHGFRNNKCFLVFFTRRNPGIFRCFSS